MRLVLVVNSYPDPPPPYLKSCTCHPPVHVPKTIVIYIAGADTGFRKGGRGVTVN